MSLLALAHLVHLQPFENASPELNLHFSLVAIRGGHCLSHLFSKILDVLELLIVEPPIPNRFDLVPLDCKKGYHQ